MKAFLAFFIVFSVVLSGCGGCHKKQEEKQVVVKDPEEINRNVVDFLTGHFKKADTAKPMHLDGDSLITTALLQKFYAKRNNAAAWSDKGKLSEAGKSFFAVLKDAESYGLIPDDYHVTKLDSLIATSYDSVNDDYSVNKLAWADMMLSDAFFQFAVHVSVGRMENDSATDRTWRIAKLDTDLVALLENTLAKNSFVQTFDALQPQCFEYWAIKKYMNDYRKKYEDAVWEHLPDRKADSVGFFAGIKKRLIQYGDYDSTSTDKDSLKLANALKKFQKSFFLDQDGKIGRNTILTLDMLPQDWIRQMAMNLERWRWEPKKFEKRHMIVDLPCFKMTVWEDDSIFMESKIVCGAIKTQTPELDSKITQIILYPYWNVPFSISWKEILPHVQRDTAYLRKNRYEVLDHNNNLVDPQTVHWKKYSKKYLPYKFRQMTGDDNALGIMKFEFSNKYGVYMHDTNAKKYFHFDTRAFSHGCMRLEKYMDLAHFLIRDDSVKLPKDTFDLWTTLDSTMKINLRKPLPIHVRYNTCDVDTDGNVFIHQDIYLRDQRMEKVLYKNAGAQKNTQQPAKPVAPIASSNGKTSCAWKKKDENYL